MSTQVEALQKQVEYYKALARKAQAIQRIFNEPQRYIPKQFNIIQYQFQCEQETLDKIYSLYQDIEDNCYMLIQGKTILDSLMPKDYLSLEIVYQTFKKAYDSLNKNKTSNVLVKEIVQKLASIIDYFYELDPCLLPFAHNYWIIQEKYDHQTLTSFMRDFHVIYVNRNKFEDTDFKKKMFETEYTNIDDIQKLIEPYLSYRNEPLREHFKNMHDLIVDLIFDFSLDDLDDEHEEEEEEESTKEEPIVAKTQPTIQNKKWNLGFINRNYGIDAYQKFYIPIKNIRVEIDKLSKKNSDVQQILTLLLANHINEETFTQTIQKCTIIMKKYERSQDPPYPIIRKNLTKLQTAINTNFKK